MAEEGIWEIQPEQRPQIETVWLESPHYDIWAYQDEGDSVAYQDEGDSVAVLINQTGRSI